MQVAALPSLAGCEAKLRLGSAATGAKVDGDKPAVTDNGNYIVDLFFKTPIKDAVKVTGVTLFFGFRYLLRACDHYVFSVWISGC